MSVLLRQYMIVSGLVLLVYDHILTWEKEVNRIWRSPGRSVKIMFFIGRYWGLAFQIINLTIIHPHILEKKAINCHTWFYFQVCGVSLSLVNLQLILMLRVYALYERSTKMACFLFCWLVFYEAVVLTIATIVIPLLKLDSHCMLLGAPRTGVAMSFGLLCMADQCILWGLTAHKYRDAIRLGLSRNPILHLVMRDTSWSCLSICFSLITTLPHLTLKRVTHIIYCLLSSLASILACRTILNMRGLSSSNGPLSIDITTMDLEQTDPE